MSLFLQPYARAREAHTLSDWVRAEVYAPLPDDWLVFVADVQGSTQAIARGEYKQVNAVDTACIIAATNACGNDAIPFVFGGDGAVLAIPPEFADAVGAAWHGLRVRALETTGLVLRIGRVPVAELRARGADLQVSKRSMPGGFQLALFRGGGVSLADSLVKQQPERYAVPDTGNAELSVQGLECRWNNVPSAHGMVLSLLVEVRGHDLSVLTPLLDYLQTILPYSNPVRPDNIPVTWPPRFLGLETLLRLGRGLGQRLARAGLWLLTGVFAGVVRRGIHDTATRAGAYAASVAVNTDHVKFDDMFRAVIDVTPQQAQHICDLLQQAEQAGQLWYGQHRSDHTLMTCFVRSLDQHVHFVDGGDGGYALAAVELKKKRQQTLAAAGPSAMPQATAA